VTNLAEVRIFGEIGWEVSSADFIAELDKLGETADLDVRINSVGGSVFEGIQIYNRLKLHKGKVDVTVEGLAASMASVIAMAGDNVRMMQASLFMIHNPATGVFGNQEDLRRVAETLDKIKDILLDAYDSKSSLTRDELSAMMDDETWLTPTDALASGFIDEILSLDGDEELDIAACLASFDLSKFKKTPTIAGEVNAGPDGSIPFKFVLIEKTNQPTHEVAMKYYVVKGSGGMFVTTVKPADETTIVSTHDTQEAANTAASTTVSSIDSDAVAVSKERERADGIRALFAKHTGHDELMDTCLSGVRNDADELTTQPATVAEASTQLLSAIAAAEDSSDGRGAGSPFVVIQDQRDNFLAGATEGMLARCGVKVDNPRNNYRNLSLKEIAKACAVQCIGQEVLSWDQMRYVGEAFGHSSSDFPSLLENVLGKVLVAGYLEWPSTWEAWAARGEVSDFKQVSRVKLGSFNNIQLVNEAGEFLEVSAGEEKEVNQAQTKGNLFSVTRQLIINDDLNSLNRIATNLGIAARRTVNADAYALLVANGNMQDGVAMFHANHNNLGTGGVVSATTIGEAKKLMRLQKFASTGAGSDAKLNLRATYILVPVTIEDSTLEFITSETDITQANPKKKNIHAGTLDVISDPELDDADAAQFYVGAATNPNIEVVFLDGNDTPFLDTVDGFKVDGHSWKVRLDYGIGRLDSRGMVRNAGS